jgi:Ca2+/H+ antiporter
METAPAMKLLLKQMRHTPLLWMLIFVPAVLVAETVAPHSHTLLFVLSVLAIVPCSATQPERLPPRPAMLSAAFSMRRWET